MSLAVDVTTPENLNIHELPLVEATPETLAGYGHLVEDPETFEIEIVTWPAQGWRGVERGTGNEGGTTEGVFFTWWSGDCLYGRNEAVGGEYLLGTSRPPVQALFETQSVPRDRVLIRHANYHPDGGQLFFPLDGGAFVAPLAMPGDDVRPEHFKAFYFDGSKGLYIHPGIWHEAIFPLVGQGRFFDRQGKVHARINCDIDREFGCLLAFPLRRP